MGGSNIRIFISLIDETRKGNMIQGDDIWRFSIHTNSFRDTQWWTTHPLSMLFGGYIGCVWSYIDGDNTRIWSDLQRQSIIFEDED